MRRRRELVEVSIDNLSHYRLRAGKVKSIRAYCETDVLNTYLLFLKFQHLRGHLQDAQLRHELERVRDYLKSSEHPHLKEFLSAWDAASTR